MMEIYLHTPPVVREQTLVLASACAVLAVAHAESLRCHTGECPNLWFEVLCLLV